MRTGCSRSSSRSVPDVVDVSSFGGLTKEYQVRIDPDKLVSYGLSLAQVEQQLTNNNANGGGSFVEVGLQQVNVRAIGLIRNVDDIRKIVIKTQNGTPLACRRYCNGGAGRQDPAGTHRQSRFTGLTARSSMMTT